MATALRSISRRILKIWCNKRVMIPASRNSILRLSRTTVCKAKIKQRKKQICYCISIGDRSAKIILHRLIIPTNRQVSDRAASRIPKKILMIWLFNIVSNLVRRPANIQKKVKWFWIRPTYPLTFMSLMIVNLKWAIWIETIITCHKRSLIKLTGRVASTWISNSIMKGANSKLWNTKIP